MRLVVVPAIERQIDCRLACADPRRRIAKPQYARKEFRGQARRVQADAADLPRAETALARQIVNRHATARPLQESERPLDRSRADARKHLFDPPGALLVALRIREPL